MLKDFRKGEFRKRWNLRTCFIHHRQHDLEYQTHNPIEVGVGPPKKRSFGVSINHQSEGALLVWSQGITNCRGFEKVLSGACKIGSLQIKKNSAALLSCHE